MTLCIVPKVEDFAMVEDTVTIATYMLQFSSTHMFIASNHWDDVRVVLDDKIPVNSLIHVNLVADAIHVQLPEQLTDATLHQLIELFPDKGGAIRRCFMTGQDVREVLTGCLV